ncbi:MAG: CoA protein activase [Chloroflexi bacterium]|nr:CoA protein activase [Chloroflexota bacterium]
MKVSFPHMGSAWVALKALFDKNGVECIPPPPCSKRTVELGTKHSPEWVCMPFKTMLGNYIEALELGADTLLGVAGPGLCRLGYYSKLHETTLRDLGYDFKMYCFDWQEKQVVGLAEFIKTLLQNNSWPHIVGDIKFGLTQLFYIDDIERHVHQVRPREKVQGTTTKIWRTAGERICAAHDPDTLKQAKKAIMAELDAVEQGPSVDVLRVGLQGEFFMSVEPFCNMDMEEELGKMRVEVTRSAYISDWAKVWLFIEALGMGHGAKVKKAARPYMRYDPSGDAMASIGETILHAQDGFDGIVHIQPFTCMPEIIAQNLLPQVSRDHDIPVLSVILDEQGGKAGLQTRLEAFVDLMRRKQMQKRRRVAVH